MPKIDIDLGKKRKTMNDFHCEIWIAIDVDDDDCDGKGAQLTLLTHKQTNEANKMSKFKYSTVLSQCVHTTFNACTKYSPNW